MSIRERGTARNHWFASGHCGVLVGVHEPKDIIVGALAGIVCGIVGYYVI